MTTNTQTPKKNDRVLFTDLDDEGVLLHIDSRYYYTVNETGLRIWQLLEKNQPISVIVDTIIDEFDGDPEQIKRDVLGLVDALAAEDLITT